MKIENVNYSITVEDGRITAFVEKQYPFINLADVKGKFGNACYTRSDKDIRHLPHEELTPYAEMYASYTDYKAADENRIICSDAENDITAEYRLEKDGLYITCETENELISGFGVNVDLNYMGKKGMDYKEQILPTSPYTSDNGQYMYCIMTRPNGRYILAAAILECDGWRIRYSPFSAGHYIMGFQFLASFDKVYGGSGRKKVIVNIQCADSLDEIFNKINALYEMPVCVNVLSGGFEGIGKIKVYGNADFLMIKSPSGSIKKVPVQETLTMKEFGFYTVTPVKNGENGLNTTLWNGGTMQALFDKSCDAIKKPYHCDDNLCEGGCFLWALLLNMRLNNHRKYDAIVREELSIIMGKGKYVPRRTIVPHAINGFPAYHIHESNRVQEQFFGVSILLEAYRVYEEDEILEFAIASLKSLVDNHMKNGMVFNGEDYTTVCCPAIPLVDMAIFLKLKEDKRYLIFEKAALELGDYLCERNFNFPTEGIKSELVSEEYEDGSISCTALSLLYICANLEYKQKYVDFAEEVLQMHNAWAIYTPDARMYGSSFRWWETIWEGDGEGPAICAGHAWTIWRAEALFWYGVLKADKKAFRDSWNGFVTNFAKTQEDGRMYSCYEADYIRGGGFTLLKEELPQLSGENHDMQYRIAHDYPQHEDCSLSRYAWARAAATWMDETLFEKLEGGI